MMSTETTTVAGKRTKNKPKPRARRTKSEVQSSQSLTAPDDDTDPRPSCSADDTAIVNAAVDAESSSPDPGHPESIRPRSSSRRRAYIIKRPQSAPFFGRVTPRPFTADEPGDSVVSDGSTQDRNPPPAVSSNQKPLDTQYGFKREVGRENSASSSPDTECPSPSDKNVTELEPSSFASSPSPQNKPSGVSRDSAASPILSYEEMHTFLSNENGIDRKEHVEVSVSETIVHTPKLNSENKNRSSPTKSVPKLNVSSFLSRKDVSPPASLVKEMEADTAISQLYAQVYKPKTAEVVSDSTLEHGDYDDFVRSAPTVSTARNEEKTLPHGFLENDAFGENVSDTESHASSKIPLHLTSQELTSPCQKDKSSNHETNSKAEKRGGDDAVDAKAAYSHSEIAPMPDGELLENGEEGRIFIPPLRLDSLLGEDSLTPEGSPHSNVSSDCPENSPAQMDYCNVELNQEDEELPPEDAQVAGVNIELGNERNNLSNSSLYDDGASEIKQMSSREELTPPPRTASPRMPKPTPPVVPPKSDEIIANLKNAYALPDKPTPGKLLGNASATPPQHAIPKKEKAQKGKASPKPYRPVKKLSVEYTDPVELHSCDILQAGGIAPDPHEPLSSALSEDTDSDETHKVKKRQNNPLKRLFARKKGKYNPSMDIDASKSILPTLEPEKPTAKKEKSSSPKLFKRKNKAKLFLSESELSPSDENSSKQKKEKKKKPKAGKLTKESIVVIKSSGKSLSDSMPDLVISSPLELEERKTDIGLEERTRANTDDGNNALSYNRNTNWTEADVGDAGVKNRNKKSSTDQNEQFYSNVSLTQTAPGMTTTLTKNDVSEKDREDNEPPLPSTNVSITQTRDLFTSADSVDIETTSPVTQSLNTNILSTFDTFKSTSDDHPLLTQNDGDAKEEPKDNYANALGSLSSLDTPGIDIIAEPTYDSPFREDEQHVQDLEDSIDITSVNLEEHLVPDFPETSHSLVSSRIDKYICTDNVQQSDFEQKQCADLLTTDPRYLDTQGRCADESRSKAEADDDNNNNDKPKRILASIETTESDDEIDEKLLDAAAAENPLRRPKYAKTRLEAQLSGKPAPIEASLMESRYADKEPCIEDEPPPFRPLIKRSASKKKEHRDRIERGEVSLEDASVLDQSGAELSPRSDGSSNASENDGNADDDDDENGCNFHDVIGLCDAVAPRQENIISERGPQKYASGATSLSRSPSQLLIRADVHAASAQDATSDDQTDNGRANLERDPQCRTHTLQGEEKIPETSFTESYQTANETKEKQPSDTSEDTLGSFDGTVKTRFSDLESKTTDSIETQDEQLGCSQTALDEKPACTEKSDKNFQEENAPLSVAGINDEQVKPNSSFTLNSVADMRKQEKKDFNSFGTLQEKIGLEPASIIANEGVCINAEEDFTLNNSSLTPTINCEPEKEKESNKANVYTEDARNNSNDDSNTKDKNNARKKNSASFTMPEEPEKYPRTIHYQKEEGDVVSVTSKSQKVKCEDKIMPTTIEQNFSHNQNQRNKECEEELIVPCVKPSVESKMLDYTTSLEKLDKDNSESQKRPPAIKQKPPSWKMKAFLRKFDKSSAHNVSKPPPKPHRQRPGARESINKDLLQDAMKELDDFIDNEFDDDSEGEKRQEVKSDASQIDDGQPSTPEITPDTFAVAKTSDTEVTMVKQKPTAKQHPNQVEVDEAPIIREEAAKERSAPLEKLFKRLEVRDEGENTPLNNANTTNIPSARKTNDKNSLEIVHGFKQPDIATAAMVSDSDGLHVGTRSVAATAFEENPTLDDTTACEGKSPVDDSFKDISTFIDKVMKDVAREEEDHRGDLSSDTTTVNTPPLIDIQNDTCSTLPSTTATKPERIFPSPASSTHFPQTASMPQRPVEAVPSDTKPKIGHNDRQSAVQPTLDFATPPPIPVKKGKDTQGVPLLPAIPSSSEKEKVVDLGYEDVADKISDAEKSSEETSHHTKPESHHKESPSVSVKRFHFPWKKKNKESLTNKNVAEQGHKLPDVPERKKEKDVNKSNKTATKSPTLEASSKENPLLRQKASEKSPKEKPKRKKRKSKDKQLSSTKVSAPNDKTKKEKEKTKATSKNRLSAVDVYHEIEEGSSIKGATDDKNLKPSTHVEKETASSSTSASSSPLSSSPLSADSSDESDYEPVNYVESKTTATKRDHYEDIKERVASADSNGYEIPTDKPPTRETRSHPQQEAVTETKAISANSDVIGKKEKMRSPGDTQKINPEETAGAFRPEDKKALTPKSQTSQSSPHDSTSVEDEEGEVIEPYLTFKYPRYLDDGEIYVGNPVAVKSAPKFHSVKNVTDQPADNNKAGLDEDSKCNDVITKDENGTLNATENLFESKDKTPVTSTVPENTSKLDSADIAGQNYYNDVLNPSHETSDKDENVTKEAKNEKCNSSKTSGANALTLSSATSSPELAVKSHISEALSKAFQDFDLGLEGSGPTSDAENPRTSPEIAKDKVSSIRWEWRDPPDKEPDTMSDMSEISEPEVTSSCEDKVDLFNRDRKDVENKNMFVAGVGASVVLEEVRSPLGEGSEKDGYDPTQHTGEWDRVHSQKPGRKSVSSESSSNTISPPSSPISDKPIKERSRLGKALAKRQAKSRGKSKEKFNDKDVKRAKSKDKSKRNESKERDKSRDKKKDKGKTDPNEDPTKAKEKPKKKDADDKDKWKWPWQRRGSKKENSQSANESDKDSETSRDGVKTKAKPRKKKTSNTSKKPPAIFPDKEQAGEKPEDTMPEQHKLSHEILPDSLLDSALDDPSDDHDYFNTFLESAQCFKLAERTDSDTTVDEKAEVNGVPPEHDGIPACTKAQEKNQPLKKSVDVAAMSSVAEIDTNQGRDYEKFKNKVPVVEDLKEDTFINQNHQSIDSDMALAKDAPWSVFQVPDFQSSCFLSSDNPWKDYSPIEFGITQTTSELKNQKLNIESQKTKITEDLETNSEETNAIVLAGEPVVAKDESKHQNSGPVNQQDKPAHGLAELDIPEVVEADETTPEKYTENPQTKDSVNKALSKPKVACRTVSQPGKTHSPPIPKTRKTLRRHRSELDTPDECALVEFPWSASPWTSAELQSSVKEEAPCTKSTTVGNNNFEAGIKTGSSTLPPDVEVEDEKSDNAIFTDAMNSALELKPKTRRVSATLSDCTDTSDLSLSSKKTPAKPERKGTCVAEPGDSGDESPSNDEKGRKSSPAAQGKDKEGDEESEVEYDKLPIRMKKISSKPASKPFVPPVPIKRPMHHQPFVQSAVERVAPPTRAQRLQSVEKTEYAAPWEESIKALTPTLPPRQYRRSSSDTPGIDSARGSRLSLTSIDLGAEESSGEPQNNNWSLRKSVSLDYGLDNEPTNKNFSPLEFGERTSPTDRGKARKPLFRSFISLFQRSKKTNQEPTPSNLPESPDGGDENDGGDDDDGDDDDTGSNVFEEDLLKPADTTSTTTKSSDKQGQCKTAVEKPKKSDRAPKPEKPPKPAKLSKKQQQQQQETSKRRRISAPLLDGVSPDGLQQGLEGRPLCRLLKVNEDETRVVELIRPQTGPLGVFFTKGHEHHEEGLLVNAFQDPNSSKLFAGILCVGDEILEIDGCDIRHLTLEQVGEVMQDKERMIVRIMPPDVARSSL